MFASGDYMTGLWKDGKANGWALKHFACRDVHEGNYEAGMRSGYGVYTWSNGDMYQGEWADSQMMGAEQNIGLVADITLGSGLAVSLRAWEQEFL